LNAVDVLLWLSQRGHLISLTPDGSTIAIEPAIDDPKILARVRARKADIIAFLKELGAPAATAHAFVALPEVGNDPTIAPLACCIACGCVWEIHGRPPVSSWHLVDDPESVALVQAAAIVASAAAESVITT
jgi:hypothetical protein